MINESVGTRMTRMRHGFPRRIATDTIRGKLCLIRAFRVPFSYHFPKKKAPCTMQEAFFNFVKDFGINSTCPYPG